MTCCKKAVQKTNVAGEVFLQCTECGKRGKGATEAKAVEVFNASPVTKFSNIENLPAFFASNANHFMQISAPFVAADKPAFAQMVKKNVRYVQNLPAEQYGKVLASESGRQSLIEALEEAFMMGATLPDMGCIVPYGEVAEFIPSVEAYRFALTTGTSAPFEEIEIEPIHKNDQYRVTRKDGSFSLEFISVSLPRGEVIGIAVYGKLKNGKVVGEIYDKERLLDKAKAHSQTYKNYLANKAEFEQAKIEGKTLFEGEREYIEKKMFKKGGDTWTKKIYIDELTCPYVGGDQPEMLKKTAGKSFLAQFARVRNSTAAINELKDSATTDELLDSSIDAAFAQFEVVPDTPEPEAEKPEQVKERKVEHAEHPEPDEKKDDFLF